ncbi:8784_t:CDS:2 [Scutellospora calospora]|uniref:8784_t:CDS:1 n=1 Tax=Scutellospora calospora TaxID=85575 RepID=A0ACA9NIR3_9GLOM|nr:8784_t:CDS:2 [Scutellospora calospora]
MLNKRIDEVEEYHLKSPQLNSKSSIYIPASSTQIIVLICQLLNAINQTYLQIPLQLNDIEKNN